jgi:hypothetical protein
MSDIQPTKILVDTTFFFGDDINDSFKIPDYSERR